MSDIDFKSIALFLFLIEDYAKALCERERCHATLAMTVSFLSFAELSIEILATILHPLSYQRRRCLLCTLELFSV
jgi:hypothetical protein